MADSSLPTKTLGEVLSIVEAGSRPSGGASNDSFGVPSLGGENIRLDGTLDLRSVRYIPKGFFYSMRTGHLRSSDILINTIGAQIGKVGRYLGEYAEAAINGNLALLRVAGNILPEYLFYYLQSESAQHNIRAFVMGSAQPYLSPRVFVEMNIPLPIYEEQQQVAEMLDYIGEAIQSTERVIHKYEKIRIGLAFDLFNMDVTHKGVGKGRVDYLGNLISLEQGSRCERKLERGNSFPVYGSNGVIGRHKAALVTGPGIIIGRVGSVGALQYSYGDFWASDNAYWVRLKSDLDFRYLFHALGLVRLGLLTSSTGVPRLDRNDVYEILVSVPSLGEQRRIARILDDTDETIQAHRRQLEKLRQLRAGLAADLFSGRVRTVKG